VPHVWTVMDYYPFCGGRMLLRNWDRPCSAVLGVCDGDCTEGRSNPEWLEIANASPVVALNEHTAAIYLRNGLRVDYTVELGVDTDAFAPDPTRTSDGAVTVYTSSAWAAFPAKGMRYLQTAIEGTDHGVQLMTGLTRDRIAEGLKSADIYVFPSVYEETWGLCLNEAMATGCCVIASDVAGARAQVHDGLGVLVPPRDPGALRDALDWLTRDHETRIEMGLLAREHVEKEHSLEAMGRRWEAVYREVTHGS
jgi:glycosyltransferase involved in cell wall biosynthesis